MKSKLIISLLLIMISVITLAQNDPFNRISFILGEWSGTGLGFGNEKSRIESSFSLVMDGTYIEVRNESQFEPAASNSEGEHHMDKGFISYDQTRDRIVFRQFNIEGYINTYLLVDSLSNENKLIFYTESIENFVPGGSARWTINKIDDNQIETIFDVSFPDQGYTCFGTNLLRRKE